MENLPHTLVGEFLDAVVQAPKKADDLLAEHPDLLNARWIHNETVLHFLAIEGFAEGVMFLSSRGAEVNAVNEFGDTALVDVAALGLCGQQQARTHGPAVELHGAGTAVSLATRHLRAGEAEVLTQDLGERPPDGRVEGVPLAVDAQLRQASSPPRCATCART
jgi:hypothetical protein